MRDIRSAARSGLTLGFVLWSLSGCAVLNKDQVGAIQEFANATKGYGTLPGGVLVAYSDIRSTNNGLQLENLKYGSTDKARDAWTLLQLTNERTVKTLDAAARADDALQILDDYAAQLTALASDDYTKQIEESATHLGQEVNGGVATYNKKFAANVSSPGATVAAVVRGLGDWYVKVQQAKLLKKHVRDADPVIQRLNSDIETDLAQFVVDPPPAADVDPKLLAERGSLGRFFLAAASHHAVTPEYIARVSSADGQIDTASALAVSAIKSARGYREAHAKLVASLEDQNLLAAVRDQITAVRAEVDATRKFQKRLKEQQQK